MDLLIALAAAFLVSIALLINWGGRIEAELTILGFLILFSVDAGTPRVYLMLMIPTFLLLCAIALHRGRDQK